MLASVCLYLSTVVQVSAATPTHPDPTAPRQLWRACSNTNVLPCIDYAAWKYHQPDAEMRLVAWRESRYEPGVSNGPCEGLFQINFPGTWSGQTINGRFLPNPYVHFSPYSARYSSLTAAWMWSLGQQRQWSTYP